MSDILNPKLKIKFLREKTLESTPIEAGNLIVTMDGGNVYFDVLSTDGGAKRINITNSYSSDEINTMLEDYYTKTQTDSLFLQYEYYNGQDVTLE